MVAKNENNRAEHETQQRPSCDRKSCPIFDVEKYLHQLRQALPHVPPISGWELKSLHDAQDYEGMVRLVRKIMNVEVKLKIGWVNSGGREDEVAWIRLPRDMPLYGTKEFKEMTITMFLRKSLLKEHTSDQVSITIAHELSHVVLESTKHPLRGCEKAVDLTTMLLGFGRLFETASHTKERVGDCIKTFDLGYLTEQEMHTANELLAPTHLREKIKALRKGDRSGEAGNDEAKSETRPGIYHTAKFYPNEFIPPKEIIHPVPPPEVKHIPRTAYRPDMGALAQAMGGDGKKPPLEAPALMAIRQLYERPLFVVALGAAIIMVPYLFLDRFFPLLGVISNAISGNVGGEDVEARTGSIPHQPDARALELLDQRSRHRARVQLGDLPAQPAHLLERFAQLECEAGEKSGVQSGHGAEDSCPLTWPVSQKAARQPLS